MLLQCVATITGMKPHNSAHQCRQLCAEFGGQFGANHVQQGDLASELGHEVRMACAVLPIEPFLASAVQNRAQPADFAAEPRPPVVNHQASGGLAPWPTPPPALP